MQPLESLPLEVRGAHVAIRSFQARDVVEILRVLLESDARDTIDQSWLVNYVLTDPRFDAAGMLVAESEAGIVGVVHAVAATEAGPGVPAGSGWIPLLAVRPRDRSRGIGRNLLSAAIHYLATRGMGSVTVGAYPPAYVTPGIDLDLDGDNDDAGRHLLEGAGFEVVECPVGMRIDLSLAVADTVAADRAHQSGYRFRASSAGDLPAVLAFARSVGADWADVLRESIVRHARLERLQVAFSPNDSVVGFATFGSYQGDVSRFGPFGVDPAHRGLSLGRILLDNALAAMKVQGAQDAWFLWTNLDGPAGRLYSRVGFLPFRRFAIYRRDLT